MARRVGTTTPQKSGALLGASLLGLHFPRLLVWPLAAAGGLYGGLGVLRTARSALTRENPKSPPQDAGDTYV